MPLCLQFLSHAPNEPMRLPFWLFVSLIFEPWIHEYMSHGWWASLAFSLDVHGPLDVYTSALPSPPFLTSHRLIDRPLSLFCTSFSFCSSRSLRCMALCSPCSNSPDDRFAIRCSVWLACIRHAVCIDVHMQFFRMTDWLMSAGLVDSVTAKRLLWDWWWQGPRHPADAVWRKTWFWPAPPAKRARSIYMPT